MFGREVYCFEFNKGFVIIVRAGELEVIGLVLGVEVRFGMVFWCFCFFVIWVLYFSGGSIFTRVGVKVFAWAYIFFGL